MAHPYSVWAHFLLVGLAGPDAKAHSGRGMLPTTNWCERSQVAGLLWLLVQRKFTFHAVLSSGTSSGVTWHKRISGKAHKRVMAMHPHF